MTRRAVALSLSLVLGSFSQTPNKQKKLRNCPKDDFYWDNCIGTRSVDGGAAQYVGEFHSNSFNGKGALTLANGEGQYVGEFLADKFNGQGTLTNTNGKYAGQFRDGKLNGQGTFTAANGSKYVGEFKDGLFSGPGTLTFATGEAYVGDFRDNVFNGQGTQTYPNGDKHFGEYRDGARNGQGTYLFANGNKYVGEYRNGDYHGYGTFTFSNGNVYVGEFRNNDFNGQGTYTFANGTRQIGQFRDGRYLGPSPSSVSAQGEQSPGFEVRLEKQGGVLLVPAVINGSIVLRFVIDSGASDVSIPADVVSTLWRTGTLADTDFAGTRTYVLADGSTIPSATFRIRSLRVGDRVLENVSGSVAPLQGSLLLGQSFLSRFRSWSIDNVRGVLVLQ